MFVATDCTHTHTHTYTYFFSLHSVQVYRHFVDIHYSLGPYLLTTGSNALENGTRFHSAREGEVERERFRLDTHTHTATVIG